MLGEEEQCKVKNLAMASPSSSDHDSDSDSSSGVEDACAVRVMQQVVSRLCRVNYLQWH